MNEIIPNPDREEIRWKFQIMNNLITTVSNTLENERKKHEEFFRENKRSLHEARDRILSGIGFGVTFFIMLTILEFIERFYVLYGVIAVIAGIVIFITINSYVYSYQKKYSKLDTKFHSLVDTALNPLIGVIARYAVDETVTKEDTLIILSYVTTYTQTISYELGQYGYSIFKKAKPDHEIFRGGYEGAKQFLEIYKKYDFYTGTTRIEDFVKEFEKNENKKVKSSL